MSEQVRQQLLLIAVGAVLFFTNLGVPHLWDEDEALHAQVAAEMYERGDYVVPYFNGKLFPDKPVLMFWTMLSGYFLFGVTEFGARCGSAVFGIGSLLLTYRLGRILFTPTVGWWGALILASTLNFSLIARAATPDALLIFFSTLALYVFIRGMAVRQLTPDGERPATNFWPESQLQWPPRWTTFAGAYAAMGMGVLAKGPVGVVLPTAVLGLFLLSLHKMRAPQYPPAASPAGLLTRCVRGVWNLIDLPLIFRTIWSMRPLTALAMVLLVAGPWYVWVGVRTGGQWPALFFGVHNFGRFLGAMENHRGSIFYYVPAVLIGFFPWSVLMVPLALQLVQRIRQPHLWRPGYVFSVCWIAVYCGFFSLASTKLPNYVLPAYPPLALLAGGLIHSLIAEPAALRRGWMRAAWILLGSIGVGIIAIFPMVAQRYLGSDEMLGLIGLAPLFAGGLGLYFSRVRRPRAAFTAFAGLSVAFLIGLHGVAAVQVDHHQNSAVLGDAIRAHSGPGAPEVKAYGYYRPSLTFYARQSIERCKTPEQVREFFHEHARNAFLITSDERYPQIATVLPPDVAVLQRCPKFLKSGEVLLLGRTPATAQHAPHPESRAPALAGQFVRPRELH
jgi:4-amino-4-deoxy-L-arabinose transferase-like glycosyltransferase